MEERNTGGQTVRSETCICRELADHFASMFGVRSEGAREHIRNARIEMLKAVRSIIDDRIEHLSHPQSRGTRVTVD